jgi:gliding motility-associated-like protein
MKGMKSFGWIFFLTLFLNKVSAQSYLQFVENKGQWDKSVAFKGDLNAGAFFLKPDGAYKMVLHNHDDLRTILQHKHGETISSKNSNAKTSSTTDEATVLRSHAYEVKFINGNPTPTIIKEKQLDTYNNYFIGNDSTKWAGGCKIYQAITYKNVYPNIDVRYYTSSQSQLKYDIIVNPGGDVNRIAMYFDGVDGLKVKDGSLRIKTSVDEIQEGAPLSYLTRPSGKQETPVNYDVKGNIVRFTLKEIIPANTTLVIDPNLIFSTFTGSKADNWGYTATYDNAGSLYAGGIVFNTGFPLSNGAFQSYQGGSNYNGNNNGSGFDMGIIKFSPAGDKMVYATYLGGTKGNEQPHSLIVDNSGYLVIAGRSNSSDYPVKTSEANINGTGWDIVITKLNTDASGIIGSIKIGGTKDDGVNIVDKESPANGQLQYSLRRNYGDDARSEVIVDASGNVYMVGCTQSSDFPVRNAFQTTNAGGEFNQDAVIIKTDNTLSKIIFSSYFGGSADDAAFVLALNPANDKIYVAGATASTDFPGNKSSSLFQSNQGGVCDGFVGIISNIATPQILQSGYFGTTGTDLIYGIQFDKLGFPYIMGTTTGDWPVVNAAFSQAKGKQFISKLQPDLSAWVYSTTFGTQSLTPNISPTAFLVDRCENVYVSGWGGGAAFTKYPSTGTAGLTTTGNPYKATSQGNDFYFIAIAKDATSQLYGDFFGQDPPQGWANHVDGGTSRFDKKGVIYQALCANCFGDGAKGSGNFPTYPPGSVYAAKNGTTEANGIVDGCNLAAIKIAFNLAGVISGIQSSINGVVRDTSGCVPLNVTFTDTIANAQSYIWNFGDGSAQTTTTVPTTSHIFNTKGFYKVMEVAVDLNTCNQYDTSYLTIRVRDDAATLNINAVKIPPCTSLAYQFTNTSTGPVAKPFTSTSFSLDFGDGSTPQLMGLGTVTHTYAAPGIYNAKLTLLDTNYCNNADSLPLQLHIAANVTAQFTTPAAGCAPYTAVFNNTTLGSGASTYIWDFGDGNTSTQTNPTHMYASTGSYNVRLIANDTGTCNKTDTSAYFTITVYEQPVANFSASPQPPANNTAITFTNLSSNATNYKWYFGDGDSLITTSTAAVSHLYNATQSYNVCLKAFNAAGCVDSICQTVKALITPVFDVPNAFSPNGDGVNDRIFVRGFGISSIQWNIYNRWGTLIYQSTNKSDGWDGTYNGKLQPQEVYHYVLEVIMSDGKKYFKKGDITLLR